jgi:hypothetical protein
MGRPSTSMGNTRTPNLSSSDPEACLTAAVSSAPDAFRCCSRESAAPEGVRGQRLHREDQAWTAQISTARKHAFVAADCRAATKFADPSTATTIASAATTANPYDHNQATPGP